VKQENLHILVIDDNLSILRLISEQFRCWNYTVETANAGPPALDYIRENMVDAITLDYNMPETNGLEVFAEIKNINPEVPVIMLTHYGNISLVEKFMEMGGAGFVEKPFDLKLLDAKIRQIVNKWLLKISEQEQKELARTLHTFTILFGAGAHEIRTALTVIEQRTRFLLNGVQPPARKQEGAVNPASTCPSPLPGQIQHLQIANRNVKRLLDLVDELLDFARIESGANIDTMELDLNQLVRETVQEVAGLLDEQPEVKLVTQLAPNLPTIRANPKRMVQIITNLLANAMKFTEKGEIGITTKMRSGECVELRVHDTGIGISPEKQPRIFSEFTESTASHLMSGSGLGLSIVNILTRNMGGKIDFESELGKGTVFYLTFPLYTEKTSHE